MIFSSWGVTHLKCTSINPNLSPQHELKWLKLQHKWYGSERCELLFSESRWREVQTHTRSKQTWNYSEGSGDPFSMFLGVLATDGYAHTHSHTLPDSQEKSIFPCKTFEISHKPYDDSTLTLIPLPSPQLKHHYNLLHHLHCSKTNRVRTLLSWRWRSLPKRKKLKIQGTSEESSSKTTIHLFVFHITTKHLMKIAGGLILSYKK